MASANTMAYAELFQQTLDEQMLQEMTSAWMEGNSSLIRYNGGNTIRVPKMETTGLGDYSRSGGYPDGSVTLEWEPHTFDKDRATEFMLDAMDVDETNFVATASQTMGQFQRTQVIPEVDAYRYSKLFSLANAAEKTKGYTADSSTIFSQLKSDIAAVQDIIGESEPLVIVMRIAVANILDESDKITKQLEVGNMTMATGAEGQEISTKVNKLDGVPIIKVSSVRMKSEYDFSATDGFSATDDALNINWIIVARRSVFGIVKQDKMKIFDPETNQKGDAWLMQYRKYHTLIVPDNKLDGLYVNYEISTADELSITVAAGTTSGTTTFTATPDGDNTLAYKLTDSDTEDGTTGIVPSGVTAYTSGDEIAATEGQYLNAYELDSDGEIVKFVSYQLESADIAA
ncbi:MAG: hypothetical protein PQJ60_10715 [Spirochaetales bacterium]|nr:hypothetical protein [Spirochaetales bacterium]